MGGSVLNLLLLIILNSNFQTWECDVTDAWDDAVDHDDDVNDDIDDVNDDIDDDNYDDTACTDDEKVDRHMDVGQIEWDV